MRPQQSVYFLHQITFMKIDQRNPTTRLLLSNYILATNQISLRFAEQLPHQHTHTERKTQVLVSSVGR